jgi:hypothetical protein
MGMNLQPSVAVDPGQTTSAGSLYPDMGDLCGNPLTEDGHRGYPPNQTPAVFAAYTGIEERPDHPGQINDRSDRAVVRSVA